MFSIEVNGKHGTNSCKLHDFSSHRTFYFCGGQAFAMSANMASSGHKKWCPQNILRHINTKALMVFVIYLG